MKTKFSINGLKEIRRESDEMQSLQFDVSREFDNIHDVGLVFTALDNSLRVVGMFSDIILQYLEEGKVECSDPQDYIEKKLGTAYMAMMKLKEKYKIE